MEKARQETYRQQLLQMRRRMHSDLNQMVDTVLRPSDDLSQLPIHIADKGTDAFDQELTLSLAPAEEQTVELVDRALQRIDSGVYGTCEACGQPIAKARLEALPYAPLCIRCAEATEKS